MVTTLPEQLLAQAEHQVQVWPATEASLRRAVSTAYYALFHLLIRSAVFAWAHAEQRAQLARMFDHRRMKEASVIILKQIKMKNSEPATLDEVVRMRLWIVAEAFVELQELRHRADYDLAAPFDQLTAAASVALAGEAFKAWVEIKDEPLSQRYLYSLLFKERS
ncbi:MAG: hypothetical protein K2X03_01305 [Bryobacteraceae bacterium]|nr:hypothetical protein [Bryobacteraceae bacterium]